jgi:type I restriction enzyme S subunit
MTENKGQMQELPMGWTWANIDDVISTNGLFCDGDWIESKDQDSNGNVRLIQLADIGDGIFKDKSNRHLTLEKSIELGCTYLSKGDLLIARLPDPLGRACIFPLEGEKKYVTAVDICIVRPNYQDLSIHYLLYLINSPEIRTEVDKFKSGSTRKRISRKNFAKIQLSIAPTLEQHRIVAKIEELFSELDNGIENLKKVREQLKTYRQAVLKYAFEGKLTKEWRTLQSRAGNPPEPAEKLLEQINTERKKHYQKQLENWKRACEQAKTEGKKKPAKSKKPKELQPLTEKELAGLPELPEGWVWCKLEEISYKITDGEHFRPKTIENGVYFLSAKDIRNAGVSFNDPLYISEETAYKARLRCDPERGDILIVSRGATVGRMCVVNTDKVFCLLGSVILIKVDKNVNSNYLTYMIKSPFIQKRLVDLSGSTAQQAIYLRDIKNIFIPAPSYLEQNQIVSEIESRLSVCDKIEQTIEDSLKKAEALRQSILKKAFGGELTRDWREKHPALITGENSADKLIEKIKAEKALAAGRKKPRSKKTKKK